MRIMNKSLEKEKVPSLWKISTVVPTPKVKNIIKYNEQPVHKYGTIGRKQYGTVH